MAWGVPKIGASLVDATGNFTLAEPAGVAQGDLMIACVAWRGNAAITPPAGWTQVVAPQNSGDTDTTNGIASGGMWYIVRGASAPALTFTRTAGDVAICRIVSYSGGAALPLDAATGATLGAANVTVTTASITTAAAGELIVAMTSGGDNYSVSAFDAATDPTTASGATDTTTTPTDGTWLERSDVTTTTGADGSLGIADAVRATAGATGTIQATMSGAGRSVMIAAAFKLQVAPTVALNTPNDAATGVSTTPNLLFTGTDTNADEIEYQVQVHTDNTFSAWNVTTAVYLQEISVNAKETDPQGLFFKPDGTKMYTIGKNGDTVDEYDLSTAWNVTTAVYLQEISVNAKEIIPTGLFFKPDGTKMYTIGADGVTVDEYDLSTAWNVTTAAYLQEIDVSARETDPHDVFFKPDGTKMYTIGQTDVSVDEYDLSTAWNVTTAVYLQEISVAAKETNPTGLFFKPDGTKMYTIGSNDDSVDEYDLSTPWNVTTAVYLQEISVAAKETSPQGLFFKPDGTKMYTIGNVGDSVDEYDLSAALINKLSVTPDATFAGTGDPHPWPSGNQVTYTVQAADTLTANTTYYWRVRGLDPLGSNSYGAWSATRSFTTTATIHPPFPRRIITLWR